MISFVILFERIRAIYLLITSSLPSYRGAYQEIALHWRHNEHDGVFNHQPHDCILNRLFKAQNKENIKAPRYWPLKDKIR